MAIRPTSLPNSRQLKVSSSYYDTQLRQWPLPPAVPFIRLRGYWLRKADFGVGQRVKVEIGEGCITIEPVES